MYHRCSAMPIFRLESPVCRLDAPAFFVYAAFLLQGKKGRCDMKITVYYEDKNHPTTIDVPDEDCEIWIEDDYQRRLSTAEDKSSVSRRTAQEIMDEDYNKPTFNSHQKETRRHVSLDALDPRGDTLVGSSNVEAAVCKEDYSDLHRAISRLRPKQRDLIKKVFWDDIKQVEAARAEGVSEAAIAQRMVVIYKRLKKFLTEEK